MVASCIWCLQPSKAKAREHIIPEALGCPDGFWLNNGEVCESCNNKLAHLDQAVIDEFDILLFLNGIPRKKNKKAVVSNRGKLKAYFNNNVPTIFINMDPKPVYFDGSYIAAFGKSKRNVKASFDIKGSDAHISFSPTFGENPKFIRGLVKIAMSSLVYFIDHNQVLQSKYDPIRKFVIKNEGNRKIFWGESKDLKFRNQVWLPYIDNEGNYSIIIRLGIAEFIVDLSPKMTLMPKLYTKVKKCHDEKGWTILPYCN